MDLEQTMRAMEADTEITKVAGSSSEESESSKFSAALEKAAKAPGAPVNSGQEPDAVDSLMKIAAQIAGTEKDAEVAHMAICGNAFADAAITKLAMYNLEAEQILAKTAQSAPRTQAIPGQTVNQFTAEGVKEAAEYGYRVGLQEATLAKNAEFAESTDDSAFEKVSEDELVKIAADLGYQDTLEKVAAEYNEGHDAALQEVHDTASTEFLKGAAEAAIVLDTVRKQQQG